VLGRTVCPRSLVRDQPWRVAPSAREPSCGVLPKGQRLRLGKTTLARSKSLVAAERVKRLKEHDKSRRG